uniref:Uncharacterized protein n=1 Tax=uncultured bacterium 5G12 TaxID=1701325 RepID=A0A166H245_9BACT|nr:hypothetical protein 5G12_053 [uncultured bacterium 5G12]
MGGQTDGQVVLADAHGEIAGRFFFRAIAAFELAFLVKPLRQQIDGLHRRFELAKQADVEVALPQPPNVLHPPPDELQREPADSQDEHADDDQVRPVAHAPTAV